MGEGLKSTEKKVVTLEEIEGMIDAGFDVVDRNAVATRGNVITLNTGNPEIVSTLKEELKVLLRASTDWDDFNRRMNEYQSTLYKRFHDMNSSHLRGIVTTVDNVISGDTNLLIFKYFKKK